MNILPYTVGAVLINFCLHFAVGVFRYAAWGPEGFMAPWFRFWWAFTIMSVMALVIAAIAAAVLLKRE